MKGYIHSTESFGTVDGPGIRYVVFMQGCPMRCLYCHNPDTWRMDGGREVTAEELIGEFEKNRAFYKNGGITVSGGEPLLQTEFLSELFAIAHERGIHTALDTSGITFRGADTALDGLMKNTDLVLLDIKAIDREGHKTLTGRDNAPVLEFAKYLEEHGIPVWVRHVVVPGYTDGADGLFALGKFIGTLKNLKALDVLPYHTLGVSKYAQLGIEYKLAGVPPTDRAAAEEARKTILAGIREVRGEIKNKPQ